MKKEEHKITLLSRSRRKDGGVHLFISRKINTMSDSCVLKPYHQILSGGSHLFLPPPMADNVDFWTFFVLQSSNAVRRSYYANDLTRQFISGENISDWHRVLLRCSEILPICDRQGKCLEQISKI